MPCTFHLIYDTGLLCHILGIRNKEVFDENELRGNIFENLIVAEYLKKNEHQNLHHDYWFWRDSNGHEIDLLTQNGNSFDIFEIKSSQTITAKQFRGMDFFADIAGSKVSSKTLIYGGTESQERTKYNVLGWADINP